MKSLRIAIFLILGTLITIHSYAQETKKESTAKFKMEIVDSDGNKKVIDTTIVVKDGENLAEIFRQIRREAGMDDMEYSKMKQELKEHSKEFTIEMKELMSKFDSDSMRKHLYVVQEELENGREAFEKSMADLKAEIENLSKNGEALKKLEEAMQELKKFESENPLNKMHWNFNGYQPFESNDMDVIVLDGKKISKNEWVDKDGKKNIIITTAIEVDGDSIRMTSKEGGEMIFIDENNPKAQNVWVNKDGEKIVVKTKGSNGNQVFFGDDVDIETIEGKNGEQKIIVKKISGEAAKGEVMFVSEDAHVIKEFKGEDGTTKLIHFVSEDVDASSDKNRMLTISPATDEDYQKAIEKKIITGKEKRLGKMMINLEIENEKQSLGADFEGKGKLIVEILDSKFDRVFKNDEGKVGGDWSMELPNDLIKSPGKYYVLFTHANKIKFLQLKTN